MEPDPPKHVPAYDPACQLCPGNARVSGRRNPAYPGTFVFDNDFPALHRDARLEYTSDGLHRAETVAGVARVICFSPRHDGTLGSLGAADRRAVVDVWAEQTRVLGETYRWVQIFENRGEAMGASNAHPHGQVWAGTSLPTEAIREDATQRGWLDARGRTLLDAVRDQEGGGPLEVEADGGWLAIVPYWAAWPFETLLIGPAPARRLDDLGPDERDGLAAFLGRLLRRYDALFGRPFPYSMGWHQAPFGSPSRGPEADAHWRLHAHVYPPLLRADAKKFMVGYELLAEPQRDLTPEDAAERLRGALPDLAAV